jgi:outer membrane protein TolC
VLKALQEVEDAMAKVQGDAAQRTKLAEAAGIASEQLRIAKFLYLNGDDGFFQILDAQHALDTARMQLSQSEASLATDTVAFFKALGGGWDVVHPTPPIGPDAPFAPVPQNKPIEPAPPIPDVGMHRRSAMR